MRNYGSQAVFNRCNRTTLPGPGQQVKWLPPHESPGLLLKKGDWLRGVSCFGARGDVAAAVPVPLFQQAAWSAKTSGPAAGPQGRGSPVYGMGILWVPTMLALLSIPDVVGGCRPERKIGEKLARPPASF